MKLELELSLDDGFAEGLAISEKLVIMSGVSDLMIRRRHFIIIIIVLAFDIVVALVLVIARLGGIRLILTPLFCFF